jgi:hypothetical protein
MKELYQAGGRGIMYYQGPVVNPSTEVNIAFGGRMMMNAERNMEEILSETLQALYRPKNAAAHRKLVGIFQRAESSYFEQWSAERILEKQKSPMPGELHLTNLFGASPGPATYLMEPYLDTDGRKRYKAALVSLLKEVEAIENDFNDNGRIGRIKQGISEALVDVNNIAMSKGEKGVWDDQQVGRQF